MSDFTELPTMRNLSGATPCRRSTAAYVPSSFSETTSTAWKWDFSPDFSSLRSWSRRSPLVMTMSRWLPARLASVSVTPSSSSTGCASISWPSWISWRISAALILPEVSSIAVSIADNV